MDKKIIGIVGGGQLGRMLTQAAKKLGFIVYVLDPTLHSPAGQVADKQIIGSFTDDVKIKELAKQVDFLTFEIESANATTLETLQKEGIAINPSPKSLKIIKDKYKQKQFLHKYAIPTAEFVEVITTDGEKKSNERIAIIGKSFGYPMLLKAKKDAYDGRGNFLLKSEKDIPFGIQKLHDRQLYVEKFVPFIKELAVMVARNKVGEIVCYPVVETTHKNNICHTVVVPAQINDKIEEKARALAIQVVEKLDGAGVFGVEMFVMENEEVLINEIAPRVHNSGHYTIEACITSQFEQHIRAIADMPLGSTDMKVPAAAMVNILGERDGIATPEGVELARDITGVSIHLYGKAETRIERKMGHITAVADTPKEALNKALKARSYITI